MLNERFEECNIVDFFIGSVAAAVTCVPREPENFAAGTFGIADDEAMRVGGAREARHAMCVPHVPTAAMQDEYERAGLIGSYVGGYGYV